MSTVVEQRERCVQVSSREGDVHRYKMQREMCTGVEHRGRCVQVKN